MAGRMVRAGRRAFEMGDEDRTVCGQVVVVHRDLPVAVSAAPSTLTDLAVDVSKSTLPGRAGRQP
jgi:hypothetical protein